MLDFSSADVSALRGALLYSPDGTTLGEIADIYADNATGDPEWALVLTGTSPGDDVFVPLSQAARHLDGLRVPYTKADVRTAPPVGSGEELSAQDEAQLRQHYSRYNELASTSDEAEVGIVRSEERLTVRVEKTATETVRLRKVVVTENVTQVVPVRHEELVIERVPVTDGPLVPAGSITEQTYEIVLHAERAVPAKETVPVERVRVSTAEVVENREFTEPVRREQVELLHDENPQPGSAGQ